MWTGIICLAALTCGVNVGWRPRLEGGMEYLIQIEPYSLDSLRAGTAIESDVPPNVKDIRSFSITVGTKTLPQESPRAPASAVAPTLNAPALPSPDARSAPKLPSTFDMSPLPLPKRSEEKPADKKPPEKPASSSLWSTPPALSRDTSPAPLLPDASGRPLAEQHAAYLQPTAASSSPTLPASAPQPAAQPSRTEPPAGSWFYPFVFAVVALAGSLSWNGFLVWSLGEARRRYRELQDYRQRRGRRESSAEEPFETSEDEAEEDRESDQGEDDDSPRSQAEHRGRPRDQKRR